MINPAQTAAFATVQGKRAKTDRVDARVLASLGESQQPEPTPPPQEEQEGLKAMRRHVDWNLVVKALGDRLRGRGKTGRVRIVAAMHKLLRLCFGVLTEATVPSISPCILLT